MHTCVSNAIKIYNFYRSVEKLETFNLPYPIFKLSNICNYYSRISIPLKVHYYTVKCLCNLTNCALKHIVKLDKIIAHVSALVQKGRNIHWPCNLWFRKLTKFGPSHQNYKRVERFPSVTNSSIRWMKYLAFMWKTGQTDRQTPDRCFLRFPVRRKPHDNTSDFQRYPRFPQAVLEYCWRLWWLVARSGPGAGSDGCSSTSKGRGQRTSLLSSGTNCRMLL